MGFGINAETVAAIKTKTDNLPADPASQTTVVSQIETSHTTTDGLVTGVDTKVTGVDTNVKKEVTWLDFWSDVDDVIDLPAVAADIDLPNVVASGLPSGVSLIRVEAILKVRAIENTSASGANAINLAQAIRVKKSTGAWGVDDIAAIDLPNNLWTVAASTRESGDVMVGDNDLKSEVDGDGTYNFRFENALVDYANLRLNDVQIGLRFYFKAA